MPSRAQSLVRPDAIGGRGAFWTTRFITDADSPYTIVDDDVVILADATGAAITVNLPPVADSQHRVVSVKNVGDGTFAVSVDPDGIDELDNTTAAKSLAGTLDGGIFSCEGAAWWTLGDVT